MILAGVTLSLTLGEKGIFNIASKAKTQTEIAEIKEQIGIEILEKQAENEGNISEDTLKGILEKYGTLSEEEKLIDKTLTTTKGKYEIKVADIFNGTTVKDVPLKPYKLSEIMGGANSPDITGFNCETTKYVTWTTSSHYQPQEEITINNEPPSNWSNYTKKEWANVKNNRRRK